MMRRNTCKYNVSRTIRIFTVQFLRNYRQSAYVETEQRISGRKGTSGTNRAEWKTHQRVGMESYHAED
jgi:hypothetical protein